jgi:hypothetical protein
LLFGILMAGLLFAFAALPAYQDSYTPPSSDLIESGWFRLPLCLSFAAALAGTGLARSECEPRPTLARGLACLALALLPLHWLAGRLLFPHALAEALEARPGELAYLANHHHGVYAWLARAPVERLEDADELHAWSERHPLGWILLDQNGSTLPSGFTLVVEDVVHKTRVAVVARVHG